MPGGVGHRQESIDNALSSNSRARSSRSSSSNQAVTTSKVPSVAKSVTSNENPNTVSLQELESTFNHDRHPETSLISTSTKESIKERNQQLQLAETQQRMSSMKKKGNAKPEPEPHLDPKDPGNYESIAPYTPEQVHDWETWKNRIDWENGYGEDGMHTNIQAMGAALGTYDYNLQLLNDFSDLNIDKRKYFVICYLFGSSSFREFGID
jgi:hypothetical protein